MVNHFEKGIRHWNNGDYELALYSLKDAKTYGEHLQHEKPDERKAYLWNLIGICNYIVSEQPGEDMELKVEEASECFKNAIELVDREPIYWRNYALLLYWSGKSSKKLMLKSKSVIDEAINRFEKISSIKHDTDLYNIQAKIKQGLIKINDIAKIPILFNILSKFEKIQTTNIAELLEMDHTECLDWIVSLPDNIGILISNNEIRINHKIFHKHKYLLEDRITTIMKIDLSMALEPNPISY